MSTMLDVQTQDKVSPRTCPPWSENADRCVQSIRQRANADMITVALLNGQRPSIDEVLVADGISAPALARWIDRLHTDDQHYRNALRNGRATGAISLSAWQTPELASSSSRHVGYVTFPDSVPTGPWWTVALSKGEGNLTLAELDAVTLLLRQWKCLFNRPTEPGMVRLLLGADDRLLHADPIGQQAVLDAGISLGDMMIVLRKTISQRWPELTDGSTHDVVLRLSDQPWWVRFRRQRCMNDMVSAYWYVELRPLEPDELAPTSTVEDDRIALALAYIHDRYHESPSLNQVATAVHISPFHFHRLFSRQVGVTPKQYLLQKQVQMAKWMLRSKRIPINRIADETGFASHGHFTSTFRRFVGISPSQYRDGGLG